MKYRYIYIYMCSYLYLYFLVILNEADNLFMTEECELSFVFAYSQQ